MSRDPQPADKAFPSLLGLVGALDGRRLVLNQRHLVLGRDAGSCQLVLEHALVSRQHAAFETDDRGRVVVRDLGSTQGTFVNGTRVTESELRDGDAVGFGREGVVAFRFHGSGPLEDRVRTPATHSPEQISAAEVKARLKAAGEAAVRLQTPRSGGPSVASFITVAEGLKVVRIGRAPDNEIVLESPAASRYHATITYGADLPMLADTGSTNGTYVNGESLLAQRPIQTGDLVFLGGFLLRINGRQISRFDLSSSRLIASDISKEYGERKVLREVGFAILPREFVGLMGPSGCGKSTLMDALRGFRPVNGGTVCVNDLDLRHNFDALKRSMGHVPQRDVLHDSLSVERTLEYAAQLRLPEATPDDDRRRIVDETIRTVGLHEHRLVAFQQLSGGQQKRLSLALELLTKPSFLFLDEPTSPLDPETSETLMVLFRRLADEGRIVVMVTHKFEKFETMHQIALLTKGGRLAYFGPPTEALRYFECSEPTDIYRKMAARDPDEMARAFRRSAQYQAHVASRLAESKDVLGAAQRLGGVAALDSHSPRERPGLRQWKILTWRYFEIKLKDRRNTALLLAQAPVIAAILALIVPATPNDGRTLFIGALVAIWFGANNAIREVVAEFPVYQRERLVNLKIPSYLLSKLTVLGMIGIAQCVLLLSTLVLLGRLRLEESAGVMITLCLTAIAGACFGLLFSAVVRSTEKAMSVLPLLLIPQLLLSGFLMPVDDLYCTSSGRPARAAEYERQQDQRAGSAPRDPVLKHPGLGPGAYAADLMIARWSVDALVNWVSRSDDTARSTLPCQMSVPAFRNVLDGQPETLVVSAYSQRVYLDWLVLVCVSALCLAGAGWSLRRKDSL